MFCSMLCIVRQQLNHVNVNFLPSHKDHHLFVKIFYLVCNFIVFLERKRRISSLKYGDDV